MSNKPNKLNKLDMFEQAGLSWRRPGMAANARKELKTLADPKTLYSMTIPYELSAPAIGVSNILNDSVPIEDMSTARAAGSFSGLVPFMENTGLGKAVGKTFADFVANIASFDTKNAGKSLMRFGESGIENVKDLATGWAESPIFNTLNLLSMGQLRPPPISPELGAITYRMTRPAAGRGPDVPSIYDPISGRHVGPPSSVYFGSQGDPNKFLFNLEKLRTALDITPLTNKDVLHNVMTPDQFRRGVAPTAQLDPDYWAPYRVPTFYENVKYQSMTIPAAPRTSLSIDPTMPIGYQGATTGFSPGPFQVRLSPYMDDKIGWGVLPHELQHTRDLANTPPQFPMQMPDAYFGGDNATQLLTRWMAETRAEAAGMRYMDWLGQRGVYSSIKDKQDWRSILGL